MPDAFFASTSKKRKRSFTNAPTKPFRGKPVKGRKSAQQKAPRRDEELDSNATNSDIDDLDLRASDVDPNESDREELANETPAEKRLRLARIYLESVKEGLAQGEGEYDAAEIDRDIISARLKEDVLENAGKLHIYIASSLGLDDPPPPHLRIKGHRLAVTSAVISHDAMRLYMAGKEGGVSCCDIATGRRLAYSPKLRSHNTSNAGKGKGKGKSQGGDSNGHNDEVLALALSGDGKYLVSGGKDRKICVWDVNGEDMDENSNNDGKIPGLRWIKSFGGHKDTISGLSFRKSTNTLYSASLDRAIKLFDLSTDVMGYVETLFGHQDSVTGLDSLKGDTAISAGSRDRSVRFWKIADETQLVFRGGGAGKSKTREILEGDIEQEEDLEMEGSRKNKGKEKWIEGSVDCVAMVDEQTFLSGGDSGSISLWTTNKKKPVFTYTTAHGLEVLDSSTEGKLRRPRWIMSLACLRYGDLFASGSWDGSIRLWKIDPTLRSFSRVGSLTTPGVINSLQIVPMPKGWNADEKWPKRDTPLKLSMKDVAMSNGQGGDPHTDTDVPTATSAAKTRNDDGIILVAGVGLEPRLGRWIRLKGEGAGSNSTTIFSLRLRLKNLRD